MLSDHVNGERGFMIGGVGQASAGAGAGDGFGRSIHSIVSKNFRTEGALVFRPFNVLFSSVSQRFSPQAISPKHYA